MIEQPQRYPECIVDELPHTPGRLRRSMCGKHWKRSQRHGDPLIVHPSGTQTPLQLEEHGEWRGDQASYGAFHKRVAYHRGRASDFGPCILEDDTCKGQIEWGCQGDYNDIFDFSPMCHSHNRRDTVSWHDWRAEHPLEVAA